eukprot:3517781-Alexandrium_andersonii.AAC.1
MALAGDAADETTERALVQWASLAVAWCKRLPSIGAIGTTTQTTMLTGVPGIAGPTKALATTRWPR